MEGNYPLEFGGEAIGMVEIKKQGLYYNFMCSCQPFSEGMYDVYVQWGDQGQKLGLLAPRGREMALRAKLPEKRVGQGRPLFELRPRHGSVAGLFVPLHPQEPFAYLRRLENAYLATRGKEMGVVLQEERLCKKM